MYHEMISHKDVHEFSYKFNINLMETFNFYVYWGKIGVHLCVCSWAQSLKPLQMSMSHPAHHQCPNNSLPCYKGSSLPHFHPMSPPPLIASILQSDAKSLLLILTDLLFSLYSTFTLGRPLFLILLLMFLKEYG